jgi:hypothetical protein
MTLKINLFAKNTLAKEFEDPKFHKGDNFYKVIIFYTDRGCKNALCSQRGTFRKNQRTTNYNCFKYNVILTN